MFSDDLKNQRILSPREWDRLAGLIKPEPVASPKPGVSDSLRWYVLSRDEGRCVYCGADMPPPSPQSRTLAYGLRYDEYPD